MYLPENVKDQVNIDKDDNYSQYITFPSIMVSQAFPLSA